MKLLMIGPFPPIINGVTISNEYLYRWLCNKGMDVSYVNTETGKIASKQGDKISLTKIVTFLSIYLDLFRITGKSVVYITCGQTFWGIAKYLPFVFYCKLLRIPYILHIHGGYLPESYTSMTQSKQMLLRYIIGGCMSLIALSESLAAGIRSIFPGVPVEVVENFYDPRLIDPSIQRERNHKPRFIFLSNLMLGKGVIDFADALILLQDTYHLDFEVALAGGAEKGIEPGLRDRIKLLGDKCVFYSLADFERKKELLYWSNIFVLPTWYQMEGQPISIIEAYVTGNLVVSTDQGGIKDISGYNTFFHTPKQNPAALAKVLLQVSTQLPLLVNETEITALQAQERFTPELFGQKILHILSGKGLKKEIVQIKRKPRLVSSY